MWYWAILFIFTVALISENPQNFYHHAISTCWHLTLRWCCWVSWALATREELIPRGFLILSIPEENAPHLELTPGCILSAANMWGKNCANIYMYWWIYWDLLKTEIYWVLCISSSGIRKKAFKRQRTSLGSRLTRTSWDLSAPSNIV